MLDTKKITIILIFIAFLLISLGYLITEEHKVANLEIYSLKFKDLQFIFLNNLFIISFCLLFSVFALPILFSFYFWFSIGVAAKMSGINPLVYFFTFSFHGIGELACSIIMFLFTINQFKLIISIIKGKQDKTNVKSFYLNFFKKTYPIIIAILIISSFIEVYVSNKLVQELAIDLSWIILMI
ncbi:hypothetical protein B4U37_21650 (plasmid) [Sutcliffiella horikoshii]|uniref:Stage II sporulation protein M n=1 Tax=Sutcliffiella horikoshii TaxID=79883 RepID=A0ABN4ZQG6_9BACI|nr:hypothetical protein B4U37_21650 [Sutcliffiella horikoshii]